MFGTPFSDSPNTISNLNGYQSRLENETMCKPTLCLLNPLNIRLHSLNGRTTDVRLEIGLLYRCLRTVSLYSSESFFPSKEGTQCSSVFVFFFHDKLGLFRDERQKIHNIENNCKTTCFPSLPSRYHHGTLKQGATGFPLRLSLPSFFPSPSLSSLSSLSLLLFLY